MRVKKTSKLTTARASDMNTDEDEQISSVVVEIFGKP